MILQEIASVFHGNYLKPDQGGESYYLQMRGIDTSNKNNPGIEYGALDKVTPPSDHKSTLTGRDVLIVSKGVENYGLYFPSYEFPTIASSTFLVVRMITDLYLPGFISWYLNNFGLQSIPQSLSGTMKVISKSELETIQLPDVPLSKQQQLVELTLLVGQQEHIQNQLIEKKTQLIKTQFKQLYLCR